MFVCAYAQKIFEDLQVYLIESKENTKHDDTFFISPLEDSNMNVDKYVRISFVKVVNGLRQREKMNWFDSRYITNMRVKLQNMISQMGQKQRQEENTTITTTTTYTTPTTSRRCFEKEFS